MEFHLEDPFSAAGLGGITAASIAVDHEQLGFDEQLYRGAYYRHDNDDDKISALLAAESDHMLSCRDLDFHFSIRRQAVSILLQAQYSCNLDPFVIYLATNYIDRFISTQQQTTSYKPWIVHLLSTACFSLASKMNNTQTVSIVKEEGMQVIYEEHAIRRMEMLVLGALGWRMRSVTPFSFLRYFLSMFRPEDPTLLAALKSRATSIIFKAQSEMKLLEYKPSVISASALLTASHELCPINFPIFRNSIASSTNSLLQYDNKEMINECCDAMEDDLHLTSSSAEAMVSSCDTPVSVTVLLAHCRTCSSSESDDNKIPATIGSSDNINLRFKKPRTWITTTTRY